MKVNILCLAGAALGLVSLFLPWWQGAELGLGLMTERDYMLAQDILFESGDYSSLLVVACTIFVVGTLLAFWSPLGGLLQVPGVLGFLAMFESEIGVHRGEDAIALGAYIGLISMVVVVVSLVIPVGVGYSIERRARNRSLSSPDKFLTVSRYGSTEKIRLNVLALFGAVMAFVLIALPWSTLSVSSPPLETADQGRPLLEYLSGSLATPSAFVFIIGSAIALFITLGVLVQLVGYIWFWAVFADSMGTYPGIGGPVEESFGIGFYLSVLAMLTIVMSIILPLGLGYYRRNKPVGSRIFVWGKAAPKAF